MGALLPIRYSLLPDAAKRLEPLQQPLQILKILFRQRAVACAAADFVEDFAGALAFDLVGNFDVVALSAGAFVQAAEDVALVAFGPRIRVVLVIDARKFGRAVLQRGHGLLLRFARGCEVAAA